MNRHDINHHEGVKLGQHTSCTEECSRKEMSSLLNTAKGPLLNVFQCAFSDRRDSISAFKRRFSSVRRSLTSFTSLTFSWTSCWMRLLLSFTSEYWLSSCSMRLLRDTLAAANLRLYIFLKNCFMLSLSFWTIWLKLLSSYCDSPWLWDAIVVKFLEGKEDNGDGDLIQSKWLEQLIKKHRQYITADISV